MYRHTRMHGGRNATKAKRPPHTWQTSMRQAGTQAGEAAAAAVVRVQSHPPLLYIDSTMSAPPMNSPSTNTCGSGAGEGCRGTGLSKPPPAAGSLGPLRPGQQGVRGTTAATPICCPAQHVAHTAQASTIRPALLARGGASPCNTQHQDASNTQQALPGEWWARPSMS